MMKTINMTLALMMLSSSIFGQTKVPMHQDDSLFIRAIIEEISITDQQYRSMLSAGTMDTAMLAHLDAMFDSLGVEKGWAYKQALNLSLPKAVEDSLWNLQHAIDLKNHLLLRGIYETYGFPGKALLDSLDYVPLLLMVHPPRHWDVRSYMEEYHALLWPEVEAGRMPPKTLATFYDNMKGKILREPQLYGTNFQFDPETQKVLPPMIQDLAQSNAARAALGMPLLQEGEYRLAE